MNQSICFKLVALHGTVFEGSGKMVVVPGAAGELGALYGHVAMIVELRAGMVRLYNELGVAERFFISAGFAHIEKDSCIVLAEYARNVLHDHSSEKALPKSDLVLSNPITERALAREEQYRALKL